jgi:hypothetical protein
MVSVMLLTVSLLTVGVLMMSAAHREVTEAGALVSRERALMSAQAALDLAAAEYRAQLNVIADPDAQRQYIENALVGYDPQTNPAICDDPFKDCVPGQGNNVPLTGQKNRLVTDKTDCAGRPCMRQGSVAFLPDKDETDMQWAQVPLADLIDNADAEARVSVWVRNNTSDVLGDGGTADWTRDNDFRVVLTAMATLRNTSVAIEQEFVLGPGNDLTPWQMSSPDLTYGGGHNNDNASVDVCRENYAQLP